MATPREARRRHPTPDDDVVDRAAGLVARDAVTGTSLRQATYAAALARAGLLQHFPRESMLIDAVARINRRAVSAIVARATALPLGRERERVVVEGLVDFAIARPGIAALGRSRVQARTSDPADEQGGLALLEAMGVDAAGEPERVITIVCAFAGIDVATHLAGEGYEPDDWRDVVVAAAMRTLGHPDLRSIGDVGVA